jgi:post-segregation antitoxin (ccd killing protein)
VPARAWGFKSPLGHPSPTFSADETCAVKAIPCHRLWDLCRFARLLRTLVCIVCGVTRLNVYLPDDLAAEAKKAGLNLSAVTQEAVRRSLAARSTDAWLAALTATPSERVPHERALQALDAAREESPTRHG